jgi:hypothetical protein
MNMEKSWKGAWNMWEKNFLLGVENLKYMSLLFKNLINVWVTKKESKNNSFPLWAIVLAHLVGNEMFRCNMLGSCAKFGSFGVKESCRENIKNYNDVLPWFIKNSSSTHNSHSFT